MSSIFGKCNTDKIPLPAGDLALMQQELNHWQADDANIWNSEAVGLGQLMLYNTPESLHEHLPLYDSLYRLCITADIRIDNRDELYPLLQINTPGEKQLSDSSIILQLYKKFGENCVKHLIGDFAFAIWDEGEQKLFCARDQMGVKPFFYYSDAHFLSFASEKKGLLCLPGIDKAIDKQFFYNQVFMPRIQAADTTLYKNIRRLPPAHTLTWYANTNKLRSGRYWTLDAFKEIKLQHAEDYYEGLLHHFDVAVKCRLRTHYPVGAELSGGMDSSAITGAAAVLLRNEGRQILTFSNAAEAGESEREFAEAVIKFNGIQDYEFITKDIWDDPVDEIDFGLKVNDGLEMWGLLWQLPIKKAAMQKQVRTLLSGFPGDEMVTYRGQFYFLDYLDHKQYGKYFSAHSERDFKKLKPFISPGMEFWLHKLKNVLTLNTGEVKDMADFFQIPASGRYTKGDVVWQDEHYRERFKSYRHLQKYRLLKPQVALRMEAETRFGLSFRMETRFPMADIRLTQFYLSMPNNIKYEGPLSRNFFRQAVRKYLPDAVFNRDDKSGATAPFRMAPDVMKNRSESILKLLASSGKYYGNKNIKDMKFYKNIHNQIAFLELLRWYEKNEMLLTY